LPVRIVHDFIAGFAGKKERSDPAPQDEARSLHAPSPLEVIALLASKIQGPSPFFSEKDLPKPSKRPLHLLANLLESIDNPTLRRGATICRVAKA